MRWLQMLALLGGAFCVVIALALVGFVDVRGCTRFGRLVQDQARLDGFLGADEEAVLQALGEPDYKLRDGIEWHYTEERSEWLNPPMALERILVVVFDETGRVADIWVTD